MLLKKAISRVSPRAPPMPTSSSMKQVRSFLLEKPGERAIKEYFADHISRITHQASPAFFFAWARCSGSYALVLLSLNPLREPPHLFEINRLIFSAH